MKWQKHNLFCHHIGGGQVGVWGLKRDLLATKAKAAKYGSESEIADRQVRHVGKRDWSKHWSRGTHPCRQVGIWGLKRDQKGWQASWYVMGVDFSIRRLARRASSVHGGEEGKSSQASHAEAT